MAVWGMGRPAGSGGCGAGIIDATVGSAIRCSHTIGRLSFRRAVLVRVLFALARSLFRQLGGLERLAGTMGFELV